MENQNYLNCKKGIHKITVSWYEKDKEMEDCHCGKIRREVVKKV